MEPFEWTVLIVACYHVTVRHLVTETVTRFVRIEPFTFRRLVKGHGRLGRVGGIIGAYSARARAGIGRDQRIHERRHIHHRGTGGRLCDGRQE